MSDFSPDPVADHEKLARFVFLPLHVDKNGRIKSGAFSHVHEKGCSIQRDDLATNEQSTLFVKDFLDKDVQRVWKGVLVASCKDVRSIKADNGKARAVCVFDTAEQSNLAHAELCQTHHIDEADRVELRRNLIVAFGNGVPIKPTEYRQGNVWAELRSDFRSR